MKKINAKEYFKKVDGQMEWLNKELASYGEKLVKKMPNDVGAHGKSIKEVFKGTFGLYIKLNSTEEYKQINIYFAEPCFGRGGNWTFYYKAVIVPNKVIYCFEKEIKNIMSEFGKKFGYDIFIYDNLSEKEQADTKYGNDIYYDLIEIISNPLKILKQYESNLYP